MKIKKMALLKLILVGLVSFSIAGCGDENMLEGMADKDSDAAKREEIRIAMDNEDYELAIESLEAQYAANPDDNEIRLALANALMGNAGFSMLDLVKSSDALKSGEGNDFTAVSALLPEQNPENLADMTRAVALLSEIPPEERTPDQNLQLAIASLSSVVLSVGTAADVNFDETSGQAVDEYGNPVALGQGEIETSLEQTVDNVGITSDTKIGDTIITIDSTVTDLINANIATSATAVGDASVNDDEGNPADVETQITDLQADLGGAFANSSSIASYLDVKI